MTLPTNGHAASLNKESARRFLVAESPSLAGGTDGDSFAYELKFLLTECQARELEAAARRHLVPDPHADPALGDAYRITSVYCDTPQLDVFHRRPPNKRRKHRLRRYGDLAIVFLERKIKSGDRVRKERSAIPEDELGLLAHPMSVVDWPGHWFHRLLLGRQLAPVFRISYERIALIGASAEGPIRLTFDRNVRGLVSREWRVEPVATGVQVWGAEVVCEFKYRAYLPALFKELIAAHRLTPKGVSKYRCVLQASGLSLHAAPAEVAGVVSPLPRSGIHG